MSDQQPQGETKDEAIRLNRYLAACGVASRRGADQLIADGAVQVNGRPVLLGMKIVPGTDEVLVNGEPVEPEPTIYLALNKPRDIVCTSDDPQGRRTFHELLPDDLPARVYCVGRLDRDSEGLLLATNDGDLTHKLLHPKHHVSKVYEVWPSRDPSPEELEDMLDGVASGGDRLRALSFTREPDGVWIVELGEGKNRHIRRMFDACNMRVHRLRRIAIGPLRLGDLRRGDWRELHPEEVEGLRASASEQSEESPATESPATEAPATVAPATVAPETVAPETEPPMTEVPATEPAPASEPPTAEPSSAEVPPTSESPPTDLSDD